MCCVLLCIVIYHTGAVVRGVFYSCECDAYSSKKKIESANHATCAPSSCSCFFLLTDGDGAISSFCQLFFDEDCRTEKGVAYIRIYKDESKTVIWGESMYQGRDKDANCEHLQRMHNNPLG